jgi:hypothetical protein
MLPSKRYLAPDDLLQRGFPDVRHDLGNGRKIQVLHDSTKAISLLKSRILAFFVVYGCLTATLAIQMFLGANIGASFPVPR